MSTKTVSFWAACAATLVWVGCAGTPSLAEFEGLLGGAGTSRESRLVAGLKQALEIGTERTVSQLSRDGGFFDDSAIRIGLPGALDKLATGCSTCSETKNAGFAKTLQRGAQHC